MQPARALGYGYHGPSGASWGHGVLTLPSHDPRENRPPVKRAQLCTWQLCSVDQEAICREGLRTTSCQILAVTQSQEILLLARPLCWPLTRPSHAPPLPPHSTPPTPGRMSAHSPACQDTDNRPGSDTRERGCVRPDVSSVFSGGTSRCCQLHGPVPSRASAGD